MSSTFLKHRKVLLKTIYLIGKKKKTVNLHKSSFDSGEQDNHQKWHPIQEIMQTCTFLVLRNMYEPFRQLKKVQLNTLRSNICIFILGNSINILL